MKPKYFWVQVYSDTGEGEGTWVQVVQCSTRCEHYQRLTVPGRGVTPWCCFGEDKAHWQRVQGVVPVADCPKERLTR